LDLPADVTVLGNFGSSDLLLARKDGSVGLLTPDMSWRLPPEYSDIDSGFGDTELALAEGGPNGLQLINANGSILTDDPDNIRQIQNLWLVRHRDGSATLFGADGADLGHYGSDQLGDIQSVGRFWV